MVFRTSGCLLDISCQVISSAGRVPLLRKQLLLQYVPNEKHVAPPPSNSRPPSTSCTDAPMKRGRAFLTANGRRLRILRISSCRTSIVPPAIPPTSKIPCSERTSCAPNRPRMCALCFKTEEARTVTFWQVMLISGCRFQCQKSLRTRPALVMPPTITPEIPSR